MGIVRPFDSPQVYQLFKGTPLQARPKRSPAVLREGVNHNAVKVHREDPQDRHDPCASSSSDSKHEEERGQADDDRAERAPPCDTCPAQAVYVTWNCKDREDTNCKESRNRKNCYPVDQGFPAGSFREAF